MIVPTATAKKLSLEPEFKPVRVGARVGLKPAGRVKLIPLQVGRFEFNDGTVYGNLSPRLGVRRILKEDFMHQLAKLGVEDTYELLTPREREVLQLVAEGKSNKEVANLLNLSLFTVETHRTHILQKLNLHSVPELILYAVRKGIIS